MGLDIQVAVIGLIGAIVGGGISSITTLLIARGERKKFARERLWELRREGYTSIVASVMPAAKLIEYMAGEYSEDPQQYAGSDHMRKAEAQFAERMQAARAAYHHYRLVVSAAFAADFEAMEAELREIEQNWNLIPPEQADLVANAVSKASSAMLNRAAAELESGAVLGVRAAS